MKHHHCTLVRDLMTADPIVVDGDTSTRTLRRTLQERRIRHMPVVDGHGRPIGIVRDRDLEGDAPRSGRSGEVLARDVMHGCTIVRPDACAGSAARLMLVTKLDALLVVGPDGRLVGILTDADFLRQFVRDTPLQCHAHELPHELPHADPPSWDDLGAAAELDALP